MKTILCFAALTTVLLLHAEPVHFDRPMKIGSHYQCRMNVNRSVQYSMRLPGQAKPVEKISSIQLSFSGWLTIRKVNSAGNPSVLEIRVDSLQGMADGKKIRFAASNRTILADLSGAGGLFTADGKPLPTQETFCFSTLFQPAGTIRLSDVIGKKHELPPPGSSWRPDIRPFLQLMQKRKIHIDPASVRCGVIYQGKSKINGFPGYKFNLMIESAKLNDYDFRLKTAFVLNADGVPVYFVRDASEIVRKVLRENAPFAVGTEILLVSKDRTEQRLTPVSKWSQPAKIQPADWQSVLK